MPSGTKVPDQVILNAVKNSISWAGVVRLVTSSPYTRSTGLQTHYKKRAVAAGADFSHFLGQASNRGKPSPCRRPVQEYLVLNGPHIASHALRIRLIRDGLKDHRCEECNGTEWLGRPIPLEVDHVNSNPEDNRIENLKILCPNCHAVKTNLSRRGETKQTR